jgi:AcrR family transcriptional regulator
MVHSSKKYNDVLRTAKELFWKHGFKRVTVEEICQKGNVSKMTFYKYFPNKTELAIEIIRRMFDENMGEFNRMMLSDIPFEEKMKKQLVMKLEGTKDLSEEFVKDVYLDKGSEIHLYWEKRAGEAIAEVINHYRTAQEKGWIRKDLNIDFVIYVINKFFDFANDHELVSRYGSMQELIMEINRFFLYGIMPRDNLSDE